MKYYFIGGVCLLFSLNVNAQQNREEAIKRMKDSIKMIYLKSAALRYPVLRQVGVSTEIIGSSRINSDLYDHKLFSGNYQTHRLRAFLNLPVYQSGKSLVSASVNYFRQDINVTPTTSYSQGISINKEIRTYKETTSFSVAYTRSDSLFKKPFTFSVSAIAVTNESFSELRMNYRALATFRLKQTATSMLTVGAVIIIDPASQIPAVPVVSYWHRFSQSKLELFADMPSRVSLRKQLTDRASLSLGTELISNLSFFNIQNNQMPAKSIYTTMELKSGPSFEYQIGKSLVVGVSGGMLSTINSRLTDKSKTTNNYFINNKLNSVPYINVTLSLLPFMKPLFHR